MKLKEIQLFLIANYEMEGLIIFWWPIIRLRLGGMLSLLICKVWSNEVHFYKWTEHTRHCRPFQIVCCHNFDSYFVFSSARVSEEIHLNGYFTYASLIQT